MVSAFSDGSVPLGMRDLNIEARTGVLPGLWYRDAGKPLRRYIRPVAEELGLYFEGFGWRTFRRLNLTAMQEGPDAVNVFEAMAQAGHTRPETTMRYTLLQSARRNHAVIGIQDRWLPKNCAGMREC
jgi:hypothetical protein